MIGLSPVVLVEFGLRIAGIAADPAIESLSAIDRDPLVDLHSLKPLFVLSQDGTRMEIGAQRMNYFCPAGFPVTKEKNVFRVFALGGSTTQGQPYRTETAFPQWLALRLEAALPNRDIEMINCGGISYASYRVSAILDEVLDYSPDLILLYSGHNEFLEARTYDRQSQVPRWLASPVSAIANLRVARVVSKAFSSHEPTTENRSIIPGEVDTLLDHPDGMKAYLRDEDWTAAVQQHFEQTLDSMVTSCAVEKVPLVLCVPASDLVNTPPFKSQPDPSLPAAQQLQVQGWTAIVESDSSDAVSRLDAANSILLVDPNHALANYVLGRWAFETAEQDLRYITDHLIAAKDHDVCPLRATSRIEHAVRKYRQHKNVYLIETPTILDRRNSSGARVPDSIADPTLFVDHVHPTIEGHQLISTAIYESLTASWLVPDEHANEQYAAKVSAHLKTLGEEYYGRAKQRLEGVNRWARRLK